MWKQACLLVLVLGCGQQRGVDKAPSCDTYAAKVADLSDPAAGQRATVVESAQRACANGRVTKTEMVCVEKAGTREDLLACTIGPMTPRKPEPPPSGPTNRVTLVAVQNGGTFKPIDLALHADQQAWYDELKKRVAACATEEVQTPSQFVVVVTFSPEAPAISLGGLPQPLSFCVKEALSLKQPASVGNGPAEFYIDLGK
ncbi:MAG: hypothetical protein JWP01_1747 [Myxococcales bacterium]|nr:hypothetical protein [Myxococcales bacterium]